MSRVSPPTLLKKEPKPQVSKLVKLEAKIPIISVKNKQTNEETASAGVNTRESDAGT